MEVEFRKRIQQVFDRIEKALINVDPDLAECEQSMGSLVVTFADRSRCILSTQPSVQQLWLALASRGTAYHFNYDEKLNEWWDDKGRKVELFSFLQKFFQEVTGIGIQL